MANKRVLFNMLKILCVLALLGVMAIGYKSWQRSKVEQNRAQAAFSTELRPLTLRQRELEIQLQSLDKEYTRVVAGLATTQVLAVGPGEWVAQDLYPVMEDAGMVGVLAMSLDTMPGEEDALSVLQVEKLEKAGWQLIYAFDEHDFADREKDIQEELKVWKREYKWRHGKEAPEKDRTEKEEALRVEKFAEWKQEVSDGLAEMGIELDDVIYFKKGAYKRSYDTALRNAGFEMIIHHGEEDRVVYADLTENRIWYPGAIPWGMSDRVKQMKEVVGLGANLVLTVSQPGDNDQDQFVSESFASLLRELEEYRTEGTLEVCTFRDMANFQAKSVVDKGAKEHERQVQAAQDELDAVNAQIRDVYIKYGME